MVACYIVGPGDKAPAHSEGEPGMGDIDFSVGMVAVEEMSAEEKRIKMLKEKNIHTVGKPGVLNRTYQLSVSIYKAEGLPPDASAFVAVRCCGVALKTPIMESSENPVFQSTILFPVYSPFLNDNISIKVWNYFFGRQNLLIAQVNDEYGLRSDFNLTTLMKVGQVIGTRWYNLYSVREDHRDLYGKRTKEGKEFVGRILLRVSLLSTDSPIMGVVKSNLGREPKASPHLLFVDVMCLRNPIGLNEKMWVTACIGNVEQKKSTIPELNKDKTAFEWTTPEKQKIDTIEEIFPIQPEYCPDVFLYLYHEVPGLFSDGEKCVAYARIKAKECVSESPQTRWVTFKPINPRADSPGDLLCNIQFLLKSEMASRNPVEKELTKYRLVLNVKSGFYIEPDITNDEDLNTVFEIFIGSKKDTYKSGEPVQGKYPIWNYRIDEFIDLNKQLQFEGDLVFKAKNSKTNKLIGQFALKLTNMRATTIRVAKEGIMANTFLEFYNVVKDTRTRGRILAFFEISPTEKTDEDNQNKGEKKAKDGLTVANIEDLNREKFQATIKLTAMGLRSLDSSAKKPYITFRLSNDIKGENLKKIPINEEKLAQQEKTCNPYILKGDEITANLPDNIIEWPHLVIELGDEKFFGCGNAYTTLLLFPYATNFFPAGYIESTLNIYNTQADAQKIKQRAGSSQKGSSKGSKLSLRSVRTVSGSHRSGSKSKKSGMSEIESLGDIEEGEGEEGKLPEIPEKEEEEEKEEPEIFMKKEEAPKKTKEKMKEQEHEEDKLVEEDKEEEEKEVKIKYNKNI